jgi:hypothetical protein
VRRIVVHGRLEWLGESIRTGRNTDNFEWRYIARGLGIYGVRALEELRAASGAEFKERFGPFEDDSQAEKIRDEISAALDSVEQEKKSRDRLADSSYTTRREITSEDFILTARTAPVFGGELSPDERERLLRRLPKEFVASFAMYDDSRIGFFYLADMNGDGNKDILLGKGDNIYLLHGDRALQMRYGYITPSFGHADNKTVISDDKQRIIRNQWSMLQINERVFFVDPNDADEIGHF